MRQVIIALFLLWISLSGLTAQRAKMTREDYIEAYSELAIKEMERSGIPASITLAQGMLESNNGNSTLAVKANNHFGIKCHKEWTGKKIHHDDDHRNECFRKYNSVIESYMDHSDFLMTRPRYAGLFELDPLDYKAWARELKKAGYATSHTYDQNLIKIIEENDLHKFDLASAVVKKEGIKRPGHLSSVKTVEARKVYKRNRINYIIVEEGDTYESLQKEFRMMPFELFRYNDLTRDSVLYPGRILYLQPKRNKAESGKSFHVVLKGETLYEISQMYGVKQDRILKMNRIPPGTSPVPGQKLYLRKTISDKTTTPVKNISFIKKDNYDKQNVKEKAVEDDKPDKKKPRIKIREEEDEDDTMEFEFN